MTKKILVTGGAGFIGSHLCKRLLDEGNYVICLDNFYTASESNLTEFIDNPNFKLMKQDVTESIDIEVDEIYNLACPASPVHYQHCPTKTIKTSVLGIINMLELAKKYDAKILQASTSEIYGDPLIHPQKESYWGNVNTVGVRSCYDEGKRCAETLMMDYYREFGTKIKIIRIFNTYGENMSPYDGRVVSNFIVQALQNKDITIYGDGSQTRSFCYVSDLVDGMIRLMEKDNFIGPVNIGNPSERTMIDLANLIIKLTDSNSKLQYCPLPQDDPNKRKPDISLAQKELGWSPKVDIEEGLKKTIVYFDKKIKELNL